MGGIMNMFSKIKCKDLCFPKLVNRWKSVYMDSLMKTSPNKLQSCFKQLSKKARVFAKIYAEKMWRSFIKISFTKNDRFRKTIRENFLFLRKLIRINFLENFPYFRNFS
jgi:hypothetical protein